MTGLVRSLQRISSILATSLLILSGCGDGTGTDDVKDDADVATVDVGGDIIGDDIIGDENMGGDIIGDDNLGGDIIGDDNLGGDVGKDVPIDSVPGDVVTDAACTPDCSGGPCTDDGCGGDCCDDPNVCDRNFDGSAMVCLPPEGTTCAEMGQCSSGCTDDACMSACYNGASADARDAIWAAGDCLAVACPEINQECAAAAYGEGGACHTEYLNCMNSCTPDCSGGPCTDDGCGGDCCSAPNVCQAPESGVGLECVAPIEKTCRQVLTCAAECPDEECAQNCIMTGSADARAQLTDLVSCVNDACPGGATQQCFDAAVQSGAECYDEFTACT